ncbi:hypothetical protein BIV24_13240 [Streptomyces colonosanans]|uniref:HTH luxR-type domain-containing protein n=2 Tax=Streptomyces colonosanans TaxID=1428652 RepID=A0A1S2PG67_9ACTN|nr:hypothetical protein BIV24_13240 [Streptomyces colonosanans]
MLHRLVPPVLRDGRPLAEPLTPREEEEEEEVAALVAGGLSNTDIGEELFISLTTVKSHVVSLQRKLAARNRVGIAARAWESVWGRLGVPDQPDQGRPTVPWGRTASARAERLQALPQLLPDELTCSSG